MDVAAIASLATEMSQARTQSAVQIAVLKQALEIQGNGALQLLDAAARVINNPPHLGQRIDTRA